MDKVAVVTQLSLFIALLYSIYIVSVKGKMTTFTKWVIAGSYTGVLLFADNVKMIVGIAFLFVMLIIKFVTSKNKEIGRAT